MEAPLTPDPVVKGSTVANVILELTNLVQELAARREFGEDVGAFLAARDLVEDFETFRDERRVLRAERTKR